MSGIYIPGMEIPQGNEVVYIFSDGTAQKSILAMREVIEIGKAIPVQDHGRLIDADALLESIAHKLGIKSLEYLTMQEKAIVSWIKAAPTVILESGKEVENGDLH